MTNLVKVLYSPSEVFASLSEQPSSRMPMASSLLVSCLLMVVVVTSVDLRTATRKELEAHPQLVEQLGPEKVDEIIQNADSTPQKIISAVTAPLTAALVILFVAGLMTGLLWMMEARASFWKVLSVAAYSYYVYYLLLLVLAALVILSTQDKSELRMDGLVKSSLGAVMDPSSVSKPILSLAHSLDALTIGLLVLLALGLSRVGYRLSFRKAMLGMGALWCVWVAVKAGFSAMF